MLDLPALPIALALSLWDALPLFLGVGVALAVLARATLAGQSFHRAWLLRETAGIEGLAYTLIFMPALAPAVLMSSIVATAARFRASEPHDDDPGSPGAALRLRAEELFLSVLVASAVAAFIKIGSPSFPDNLATQLLVAGLAGLLAGNRSGAAAVPAIAIAVHLGGHLPALVCVLAATVRSSLIPAVRRLVTPGHAG